jgi:hypothetical protein
MQSKKIRKRGLQPLKRYQVGGVTPCPNPPCPPDNEIGNAAQRLVDSGAWKLGPNGELLRMSPEEMNQASYQRSQSQAMGELSVEDPRTFAPTTSGFMTPERKTYLESRAGKLTPEEAREYATVSFDPFEGPNMAFSFAAGATPLDPVGQIIGRGLTAAGQGWRALKNPRVMPVMEEARIEASIQGIREHFGIELGHVVDGVAMTPEKMRQIVIKDLVGESASAERLARANQAIDQAIDEAMPKALETVMRRSEGNLLDIPVDTRHPQVDRVRMRFLGSNSKLWQQANKEGLIPVTNVKQAMKDMSEMEKYVLEEAIFSAPVYNKKGVLLAGEELQKAQDAIISAITRSGQGVSIEESAEGIGDISGYRVNLNQLKGLSEGTSATMNPVRSFELTQGSPETFGTGLGVRPRPFSGNTYADYGISKIGYNDVNSKTFVVGADDLSSNVNHFQRGELSHFRVFTNDRPPAISRDFPGTRIDVPITLGNLSFGRKIGANGYLSWFQDMSTVPSGLGFKRGGNVEMGEESFNILSDNVKSFQDKTLFGGVATLNRSLENAVSELGKVSLDASSVIGDLRKVQQIASDVNAGRGSIMGPNGDNIAKELLEFAKLPNRRELIEKALKPILTKPGATSEDVLLYEGYVSTINRQLDGFVENAAKEQQALTRLGESPIAEEKFSESMSALTQTKMYLDQVTEADFILKDSLFDEFSDRFRSYDFIIDSAKSDFSFGSWSTNEMAEALDVLEGSFLPSIKDRFDRTFAKSVVNLTEVIEGGKVSPEIKNSALVLREQLLSAQGRGIEFYESINNLAKDAAFLQDKLRDKYIMAFRVVSAGGVPENIQMKAAVEEVERKSMNDIIKLKNILLELEEERNNAVTFMRNFSNEIDPLSEEIVESIPRLYSAAANDVKVRIESVLQDQTALDYFDVLKYQGDIQGTAKDIRKQIESGDLNSPELNKIFFSSPEKDKFYVTEIQSDFVQKSSGGKSGEMNVQSSLLNTDMRVPGGVANKTTQKGQRADLDSFQKNWRTKTIQQAVLQGRKAGKNEILFPTYKTADNIQGWSGSKDTGESGAGNRITYQGMDKHIQKATGIKPTKVKDSKGNEWWSIKLDPDQKYEFPDFKHGGIIRLKKK